MKTLDLKWSILLWTEVIVSLTIFLFHLFSICQGRTSYLCFIISYWQATTNGNNSVWGKNQYQTKLLYRVQNIWLGASQGIGHSELCCSRNDCGRDWVRITGASGVQPRGCCTPNQLIPIHSKEYMPQCLVGYYFHTLRMDSIYGITMKTALKPPHPTNLKYQHELF